MATRIRCEKHPEIPEMATFVACYFGDREEDPSLARQREAGEEDQSQPGWDAGA
jgi:hypothetical protein